MEVCTRSRRYSIAFPSSPLHQFSIVPSSSNASRYSFDHTYTYITGDNWLLWGKQLWTIATLLWLLRWPWGRKPIVVQLRVDHSLIITKEILIWTLSIPIRNAFPDTSQGMDWWQKNGQTVPWVRMYWVVQRYFLWPSPSGNFSSLKKSLGHQGCTTQYIMYVFTVNSPRREPTCRMLGVSRLLVARFRCAPLNRKGIL